MAPANPHIMNQLRQLIYYNLDCNLLANALFIAGRLHACDPKAADATYLLALCHLRSGQLKSAYDHSKSHGSRGSHVGCAYVFAQACLGLETYGEGIVALERSRSLWTPRNNWNKHSDARREHLPDAPAVYCLQGKLFQAYNDTTRAIESYAAALKLNPFMWDAFLGLCDLGVNVRIPNIFKMSPEMLQVLGQINSNNPSLADSPPLNVSDSRSVTTSQSFPADPFNVPRGQADNSSFNKSALFEKLNGSSNLVTPIGNSMLLDSESLETPIGVAPVATQTQKFGGQMFGGQMFETTKASAIAEPPQAPVRKPRMMAGTSVEYGVDGPPRMRTSHLRMKSRSTAESDETDNVASSMSSMLAVGITDRKRSVSGQAGQNVSSNSAANSYTSNDPMAPQRRSVRLFNQIRPQKGQFASTSSNTAAKDGRDIKKARGTATKARSTHSTVGRVVSGNRKHGDPMDIDGKDSRPPFPNAVPVYNPKPATNDKGKEYESLQWLLDLFTKLGSGYFALSHYQCQEALQIFNSISSSQRETPWVMAQIGKSLYGQAAYAEAAKCFAWLRAKAPSRLEDMEIYSTVLWQLQSEIDLAFIAHELLDIDRNSPEAWCAVGNSFSLQRDHDQALKCFKRATQLDPKFAYGFTLQGHEHVANEEYDKAMVAYRSGIAAQNRHYNAWYGLGKVYEKQGKYDMAEQHYTTASQINPTNPILVCCIGVVLEKLKKPRQALEKYTRSSELDPKSSNPRHKKARVLMTLQQPELALAELKILKDMAPDEPNVHFYLGKVYKILKNKPDALKHFTIALNLDPRASHYIKEEMEQMEDDSDDDAQM